MTPKAQQAAMAKLDGWTSRLVPSNKALKIDPICGGGPLGGMQFTWWKSPLGEETRTPPDYLSNGDAARAVAKILGENDETFRYNFIYNLRQIQNRKAPCVAPNEFAYAVSTGCEITEAVLRAARKWVNK